MKIRCIVFCVLSLLATCLALSACDAGTPTPEDKSYRVMVSLDTGATVQGENPITVEEGGTARFQVEIADGYAFSSVSGGVFDQALGVLTVEGVSRNTNIDFYTAPFSGDKSRELYFSLKGGESDVKDGQLLRVGTLVWLDNTDEGVFAGWSFGAPLYEGGSLFATERRASFYISESYLVSNRISIYPNFLTEDTLYIDANGGSVNPDSTNMQGSTYYSATEERGRVRITYTDAYLSYLECASTFWDDGSFYREGYVLTEYNTEPDGSGTGYSLGSKLPLTPMGGEQPVLYCIWSEDTPHGDLRVTDVRFPYASGTDAVKAPHWVTDDSLMITEYLGNDEVVVIPERIGDKYVTAIASGAFRNKDVRVLVLSRRLLKVEDGAFVGCSSLETIYYPDGLFIMNDEALDEASYTSLCNFYVNATLAPRNTGAQTGALAVKLSRLLASEDMNRIIVIGGSSSLQGLGTAYLESLLDHSYRVVNFGTTRTTNGMMYLEAMGELAHEGDLIVYAPENSAYMMGEREIYWKTVRDLEGMVNIWRHIDISGYTGYLSAITDFNRNHSRFTASPAAYEDICRFAGYTDGSVYTDKYGDYHQVSTVDGKANRADYVNDDMYTDSYYVTMNERYKSRLDGDWNKIEEQEQSKDYTDPSNPTWCSITDSYYRDAMNRAIAVARGSGARVYFGFCPVDGNKLVEGADSLAWLLEYDKMLEDSFDFDGLLGSSVDYIFSHEYFFDCAFHTNDYGRTLRTYRLYLDLCRLLSVEEVKDILGVGTAFEGCLFEAGGSGEPLYPWSPSLP